MTKDEAERAIESILGQLEQDTEGDVERVTLYGIDVSNDKDPRYVIQNGRAHRAPETFS